MRALRRSITCLVLAGFVSAQAAVWVAAHHAALEDDAACAAIDGPDILAPHHQDGVQFEGTNPPSPIEHCALCHMQRAVRHAWLARTITAQTVAHSLFVSRDLTVILSLVAVRGISPRGPPSFSA
jgi:hypothetical protein